MAAAGLGSPGGVGGSGMGSRRAPSTSFSTAGVIALAVLGPLAVLASVFTWMQTHKGAGGGSGGAGGGSFFDGRRLFTGAATLPPPPAPAHPKTIHRAVGMAYPREGVRLERIQVMPNKEDKWRLCSKPAGAKSNPCPEASFFSVAQTDGHSDPVVAWLLDAEDHVQDLFAALLSTNLPDSCLRATKPCLTTASQFSAEERQHLVMLDIGSNHGFYSLMAAASAPWLKIYAFEPQPHCAMYIQLAMEASGLEDNMFVLNSLAGTKELATPKHKSDKGTQVGEFYVPPKSRATQDIPRRTGCRGTFPTVTEAEAEAVRTGYSKYPGALDSVPIHYVNPADLVPAGTTVLLAKIDVEGFEEEVLASLDSLLKAKRIYNLLIEFNKSQKLRRMGRNPDHFNDTDLIRWTEGVFKRLQDYGYTLVPQWGGYREQVTMPATDASRSFMANAGWASVDMFAYLSREDVDGGLRGRSKKHAKAAPPPPAEDDDLSEEAEPEEAEEEDTEDSSDPPPPPPPPSKKRSRRT